MPGPWPFSCSAPLGDHSPEARVESVGSPSRPDSSAQCSAKRAAASASSRRSDELNEPAATTPPGYSGCRVSDRW